jgi:cytochrome c-type biogenesis protein CcmE
MTRRQRRVAFLFASLGAAVLATVLVVFALGDSVLYFYSPSEAKARSVEAGKVINLGGLVLKGSIERPGGVEVDDLPDLVREGQGVVMTGAFRPDGVFAASKVLAKHDENYMPPEVARSLKERDLWKPKGE